MVDLLVTDATGGHHAYRSVIPLRYTAVSCEATGRVPMPCSSNGDIRPSIAEGI